MDRCLDRTRTRRSARRGGSREQAAALPVGPGKRKSINAGDTEYVDTHLSHSAQRSFGFYGNLDVAVVEVAAILPNGLLVPGSSVGNSKTWLDLADKVILEVNSWHSRSYEGFHDVYYGTRRPPERLPIQLLEPMQRIGDPYLRVDPSKVVAVVETNAPDRDLPFKAADEDSKAIASHLVDFLRHEIHSPQASTRTAAAAVGRRQCRHAVMGNLADSEFEGLTAYTEVIQDGMLDLIDNGKLASVSATSILTLGRAGSGLQREHRVLHKGRILLRTQEMSNHPEAIRRLGVIAINGMVEADIYGNEPHRRHGLVHHQRHRRIRRLRPQRLPQLLRVELGGQGRCDSVHRALRQPHRPHRA